MAITGLAGRRSWDANVAQGALGGGKLAIGTIALAVAMLALLRPAGPGNSSPVDVLIALALGGTFLWAGSSGAKLRFPYGLAMGVLLGAGALAALTGPFASGNLPPLPLPIRRATGILALIQDLVLFAWCLAIANGARSGTALKVVLHTWAWSAIAWAGLLDVAYVSGNTALSGEATFDRAALTFTDPNMAASYYFVSIMIIAATRCPRNRLARVGAYALLVTALALTRSNGGITSLLIATAAASIGYLHKRVGTMATVATVALVGPLVAVALSEIHPEEIQRLVSQSGQPVLMQTIGRSDESARQRETIIYETLPLYFEGDRLLGWGPGATQPALLALQAPYGQEAHDDYLAALVERGVLGAIGLLLLIASVAVRTWSVVARPLSADFALAIPRKGPLLGAILGVAASATFYQVLHFRHVWALLAVVAALHLWGRGLTHVAAPGSTGFQPIDAIR